jgi:APA family basic amino acid/polyamine antiporter
MTATKSVPPTSSMKRTLGLGGAVMLGLGSILGTGVFVSLAIAAGVVGDQLVVAIVLAGLVALANGISSAQLAAAHPVSGGTYAYGRKYLNPHLGFVAGWMFLVAKSASAATAALGLAGYGLGLLGRGHDGSFVVPAAVAACIVTTALVVSGLRRSNAVNTVLVIVTVVGLATFVSTSFLGAAPDDTVATWGAAERATTSAPPTIAPPTSAPPTIAAPETTPPSEPAETFFFGVALLFVAFTGYGRVATMGEEVKDPRRTIPVAVVATLVATLVIYVLVALAALHSVGAEAFGAAVWNAGAAPLERLLQTRGHAVAATVVAVSAITAMAGVLLNLVLGLSRVLFAMGRDQQLPGIVGRLSPEGNPTVAIAVMGGVVALLTLLGDVKTTWAFSALTVLIYYGLTNASALRLPTSARSFPRWISWFGLTACLGLALFIPWTMWVYGGVVLGVGLLLRAVTT